MNQLTFSLSEFKSSTVEQLIEKGEKQGYIVLPWGASKKAGTTKNRWYRNRQKQNKPYIIILLFPGSRGLIRVDGDHWDGLGGLKMDENTLMSGIQDRYDSFPKESIKKMRLKAGDTRAILSRNRAFAYFPPGDTTIVECILRHVNDKKECVTK